MSGARGERRVVTHEYLAQLFEGVRVHGGGVSRQLDQGGVTVSLFGTVYSGIDVETAPVLVSGLMNPWRQDPLGCGDRSNRLEGRTAAVGGTVDVEVLRRLIPEVDGGVRVRDLAGRTGTATAVSGGLAVVNNPNGVERLDPAQLAWAGLPIRTTDPDPAA